MQSGKRGFHCKMPCAVDGYRNGRRKGKHDVDFSKGDKKEMSKRVEKADAPIHTILKMKWSTLEVTFKALEQTTQSDCIIVGGDLIRTLVSVFHYGKPKLTFSKIVLCPKCKQESPLEVVNVLAPPQCPKCGANLKEAIEI